jgi:hypothetical protein
LGKEWTQLEADKSSSPTAKVMAVPDPNPDRNVLLRTTTGRMHATVGPYPGKKLTKYMSTALHLTETEVRVAKLDDDLSPCCETMLGKNKLGNVGRA